MKMTKKEAVEILKYYDEQPYFFSKDASAAHAFKMAISALEESDKVRRDDVFAAISRAKTLLTAYRDMYDRAETEDRFYGKTLPELTVMYDKAECDASCLYDDIGSLLDDIEYLEEQFAEIEEDMER